MKKFRKVIISFSLLLLLPLFLLTACGNSGHTVKLGIMGGDKRIWNPIADRLKKKGINLQLISFTDYSQPNSALQNHDVDINAFQNFAFQDNWNNAHHTNIVSIGKTIFSPLSLYSKKVSSLKDIKDGAKIAVANDVTNEARGLKLLSSAGLIKLDNSSLPSTKNIKENKKNLQITPLDASQIPRSLVDEDAAVVNGNFALDAKLPNNEVIFTEPTNKAAIPYINIISANKSDKNNKYYKEVVKEYQSDSTKQLLQKLYKGKNIPAWNIQFK